MSEWRNLFRRGLDAEPEAVIEGARSIPSVSESRKRWKGLLMLFAMFAILGGIIWWLMPSGRPASTGKPPPKQWDQNSMNVVLAPPDAPPRTETFKPPITIVPAVDTSSPAQARPKPVDPLKQRKESPTVIFGGKVGHAEGVGVMRVSADGAGDLRSANENTELGRALVPTATVGTVAKKLANLSMTLAKGTMLDCELQTAISTEVPSMPICILAENAYGADGRVILLDRGTILTGELRGNLELGKRRAFVLWTDARTPQGVVVELNSPGTDALGRGGLAGDIDTKFWQRFGPALMLTLVSDLTLNLSNKGGNGQSGSTFVFPGTTNAGKTAAQTALEADVRISPTLTINQGTHIKVEVARNIIFDRVYALAHVDQQ